MVIKKEAIALIRQWDGQVDAFGLGGTDMYIYAGNKRFTFRESAKIAAAAHKTSIVDGSGLKNTLERRMVKHIASLEDFSLCDKHTLWSCVLSIASAWRKRLLMQVGM